MLFNFDTCPDRSGTESTKWTKYAGRDIIPAWVADMDFASPPEVISALQRRLAHPVLGYATARRSTLDTVLGYLEQRHGWKVKPDWVVFTPALVPCLHGAIRAVGAPGDHVITTVPIYPPFLSAPVLSGSKVATVSMKMDGGRWTFDFDTLEDTAKQSRAKVFLLCNPHNPLGRVFTRTELERLADFAARHELIVCSDEIHCDLVLDPATQHVSFASLSPDVANRSISLFATSKTYNTAGLLCGYAVIPDEGLRARFRRALAGVANEVNIFGLTALEAAYRHGEPWRQECLAYLRDNLDLVMAEVSAMPGIRIAQRPEATYLAWLDVRALGVTQPLETFEAGGVGLGNGVDFGMPGFVRLNFGCPRERLREILFRIRAVAEKKSSKS
ncbi:MAG: PatB family C-S lyase [Puniceicoccales bacterium]|jgi:cystathionine beta-lyase|nr:PatB family C-S lyase [Puniceicoccales bacterium]